MSDGPGDPDSARVVVVEVTFPDDVPPVTAARLRVEVEDYSRADASTPVIGQVIRSDVAVTPGGKERLEVDVPERLIDDRDMYSVRVHLDLNGSGSVESGDLITMQTNPVLTRGHPDEIAVEIRQV